MLVSELLICVSAFASLGFKCVQTCRLIAINLSDLEAETRCPVCLGKCITVASATHHSSHQLLQPFTLCLNLTFMLEWQG